MSGNASIELKQNDAVFLGISSPAYAKTLVRAINRKFTICMLQRYAPANREEQLAQVRRIADAHGIEPMIVSRPVHIYCGNNYLPAIANVGSNNFCLKRGHGVVNKLAT